MFVDMYGQAVDVRDQGAPGTEVDKDSIDCLRDLGMMAMTKAGIPQSLIARYYGCTDRTVRNRLKGMPAEAREHYEPMLESLGKTIRDFQS